MKIEAFPFPAPMERQ